MLGRLLVVLAVAIVLSVTHASTAHHSLRSPHTAVKTTNREAKDEPQQDSAVALYLIPIANMSAVNNLHVAVGGDGSNWCAGEGKAMIKVQNMGFVFCVVGESCGGEDYPGVCPGPQEGLPFGSHCTIVKPGVYGCVKNEGRVEADARVHVQAHSIKKADAVKSVTHEKP